ncbi:hypothetical protein MLD38_005566 [Melastoma candidum]|uniref:Uncharacterized protein n=1 Tax=Melastoma candidum TaxID=119954 RepID=A0ACB9RJT9_9MYRT|nr:hypothetical protein MLD38_005566 [Melastoma candidum]
MSSGSSSSSSIRCAGCKHLRRKCPPNCILAPYFPPSNPRRFASVHEVFGASNVTKTLEQLPEHLRRDAAESMVYEAMQRMRDPVYGCAGIITHLQRQIIQLRGEISRAEGEIARIVASAQQHQSPPLPHGNQGIQGDQSSNIFSAGQSYHQDDFVFNDGNFR